MVHKSLLRNSECKIVPIFEKNSEELVKYFANSCDEQIFFPYSFPADFSFDYPSELELVCCAMHYGDGICAEDYFPSQELLERFKADRDGTYGDNYYLCQSDRKSIIELLIEAFIRDQKDNIPTTHADFLFHFPSELEGSIPEYLIKIADSLTAMFPDKQIRVSATSWSAEEPCSSAGFYLSYICYNIYEIENEKDQEIFMPPTKNVSGHGKQAHEWDILSDDDETDKYLKGIINQFSESALYNNAFTSENLIDFVECSSGYIGMAEVHAYNADYALTECLDIIFNDYRDVVEDVSDIRFIIYIGSNFEGKDNLIHSAVNTIRKYLRNEFGSDQAAFKVAIAHCEDLCGGGDLILYALS